MSKSCTICANEVKASEAQGEAGQVTKSRLQMTVAKSESSASWGNAPSLTWPLEGRGFSPARKNGLSLGL
jgi:hypothetical protein